MAKKKTTDTEARSAAARILGSLGGKARVANQSAGERRRSAQLAARARWGPKKETPSTNGATNPAARKAANQWAKERRAQEETTQDKAASDQRARDAHLALDQMLG